MYFFCNIANNYVKLTTTVNLLSLGTFQVNFTPNCLCRQNPNISIYVSLDRSLQGTSIF